MAGVISTPAESQPTPKVPEAPDAGRPLRILFLAAEMAPYVKTSGVADVVGALPRALRALGHDARVAIPRYGRIDPGRLGLRRELGAVRVPLNSHSATVSVLRGEVGSGLPVYLIDSAPYFGREGIYGYPDDGDRFILFCRAQLAVFAQGDIALQARYAVDDEQPV